jgi:hypothetical protein
VIVSAFQLHRVWLLAFLGAMLGMFVLSMLISRGSSADQLLVPTAIFVLFWFVALVSLFGLAVSANRLAKELGVWKHEAPLPLLYAVGLGAFYSVWLDRKASQSGPSLGD